MLERWHQTFFRGQSSVAVAISRVDEGQRHLGLIYFSAESGESRLLHLAWHFSLKDDPATNGQFIVQPRLSTRTHRQLAAKCRQVWRENGRNSIPYGFGSPADAFDEMGSYLMGPGGRGLTCSTFVLGVFHWARIPMIQYESWPVGREEDMEFQRKAVEYLRRGASPEHVRRVTEDIGTVRFRPEEVAAASGSTGWPVPFAAVEAASVDIVQKLNG